MFYTDDQTYWFPFCGTIKSFLYQITQTRPHFCNFVHDNCATQNDLVEIVK